MKKPLSILTLAAVAAPLAAAQGTFQVITNGVCYEVSADGSTVTGSDANGAYVWNAFSGLSSIGLADSTFGLSKDGYYVCGTTQNTNGDYNAAIYSAPTGWVDLFGFPGANGCGSDLSSAYEVDHSGTTVVGLGWSGCSARAFKWTAATGMVQLPGILPTDGTRANTVSGDGRYIGGWETVGAANPRRATLWSPAGGPPTLVLQSPTNTAGAGEVLDLNRDGTVFSGIHNTQACVWTRTGGLTLIPKLPGFSGSAYGQAVSDDGCFVVGSGNAFTGQPWVWTPEGGTVSLANFLTAKGITGWVPGDLHLITGMSADGRVIGGYAFGKSWVINWDRPQIWVDQGGGTSGTHGQPVLAGYGCPIAGKHVGLSLSNAKANSPVGLVIGVNLAYLPLFGGVLVPAPNLVITGLLTNAQGELAFGNTWPVGVPSGAQVYFQQIVSDPAGQGGYALSNGLELIAP